LEDEEEEVLVVLNGTSSELEEYRRGISGLWRRLELHWVRRERRQVSNIPRIGGMNERPEDVENSEIVIVRVDRFKEVLFEDVGAARSHERCHVTHWVLERRNHEAWVGNEARRKLNTVFNWSEQINDKVMEQGAYEEHVITRNGWIRAGGHSSMAVKYQTE
jgi:hypothetical protein